MGSEMCIRDSLSPALARHHVETVVCRGDLLLEPRIWQQIAGELLAREPVIGDIVVETPDHVIPIGAHVGVLVAMVADRVGIAHELSLIHI